VTLIISVLTDEYVALVSDRRVTWPDGRQEDTDTKTFNLFGQFLMGFTGYATINDLRMEQWVADILGSVAPDDYFNVLAQEISAIFSRLPASKRIPQAFLATGYASLQRGGRVHPMNVIISNSIDDQGNYSACALQPEFTVFMEPLGNMRQLMRSVGWPMPGKNRQILEHQIRVVVKADPSNPERAAGPLVYALRETATKSHECVGKSALFASLPRCVVPSPTAVTGRPRDLDFRGQAVTLYLPEAARNPKDAAIYVPAIVTPGLRLIGVQMHAGIVPPTGNRDRYSAGLGYRDGHCVGDRASSNPSRTNLHRMEHPLRCGHTPPPSTATPATGHP
jgi:hypothetical protein